MTTKRTDRLLRAISDLREHGFIESERCLRWVAVEDKHGSWSVCSGSLVLWGLDDLDEGHARALASIANLTNFQIPEDNDHEHY